MVEELVALLLYADICFFMKWKTNANMPHSTKEITPTAANVHDNSIKIKLSAILHVGSKSFVKTT